VNTTALLEMLAELASGIPALPNAACREQRDLFDSCEPTDIRRAISVCGRCPARLPCASWADSLPPRRLDGVVGGRDRSYDFRYAKKENTQ
jgi:Transcription factor WhiB